MRRTRSTPRPAGCACSTNSPDLPPHGRTPRTHQRGRGTIGHRPRHIAFAPDGNALYVIGELTGAITVFAYDGASGRIGRLLQTLPTSTPGFTGTQSGAEIAIHPSGGFLYASNRGSQSIAGYRIDRATGTLTSIGLVSEGVSGPTNFAVDPSGRHLWGVAPRFEQWIEN